MAASIAIGNKFVQVYFTALNSNPTSITKYFSDDSNFTFGYEEENLQSQEDQVSGTENIKQKIEKLGFNNVQSSLTVVDCQETHNGVLVMVVGNLTNNGKAPQKFVQTFVLATSKDDSAVYFCRNAAFRFLKEPVVVATSKNDHQQTQTQQQPEVEHHKQPVEIPKVEQPITQVVQSIQETKVEKKVEEKKTEEKKQEQPTQEKAHNSPSQPRTQKSLEQRPKNDKKKNPKKDREQTKTTQPVSTASQPSTWANLVSKTSSSPPNPSPPTNKPPTPVNHQIVVNATQNLNHTTNSNQAQIQKPAQQQQQQQQQQSARKTENKPERASMKDGFSVYVSNIPFSATEDSLRAALGPLGEISSVVLKSAKGFCFLEYNDLETVHKVIEKSKSTPVYMDGRLIVIEEKKPKFIVKEKKEKKISKPRNGNNNNGFVNGKDNLPPKPKKSYFKENIVQSSS